MTVWQHQKAQTSKMKMRRRKSESIPLLCCTLRGSSCETSESVSRMSGYLHIWMRTKWIIIIIQTCEYWHSLDAHIYQRSIHINRSMLRTMVMLKWSSILYIYRCTSLFLLVCIYLQLYWNSTHLVTHIFISYLYGCINRNKYIYISF